MPSGIIHGELLYLVNDMQSILTVYYAKTGELAYQGRMEFRSPESGERWIGDRVETLREAYRSRLAEHRARIEDAARRIGWSFLVHHTDRPAAEPLLTLIMRLQGVAGDYRWKPDARVGEGAA